jgi:hypothetical protein
MVYRHWVAISLRWLFASIASGALLACGGGEGGGSDPVAAPTPTYDTSTGKAPGVTYTVLGIGGIGSAPLLFDVDGGFKVDGSTVTLSLQGPTGCSVSDGTHASYCNALAGGKVLLTCETLTGTNFDAVLLRPEVQEASVAELAGRTLTAITCSAASEPHLTGATIEFNGDSSIAVQVTSASTHGFGTGLPAILASPGGSVDTGAKLRRWALFKVADGSTMNYFLFELFEQQIAGQPDSPVTAYRLQLPI